jgi:hypothetical protein
MTSLTNTISMASSARCQSLAVEDQIQCARGLAAAASGEAVPTLAAQGHGNNRA